jgi:hypothetical protein
LYRTEDIRIREILSEDAPELMPTIQKRLRPVLIKGGARSRTQFILHSEFCLDNQTRNPEFP